MKIQIHPDYTEYTEFLQHIPHDNYAVEKVFCNHRNTVEKVTYNKEAFVIKKFKTPLLINRIIYTWFRKSKARRSYEYAEELQKKGVDTARPIAYIEEKKNGLFHTGYFISQYLPYPLLPETELLNEEEILQLKDDFLHFTVHLHQSKIIHKDYNPRNILYHKVGDTYRFALLDINRLKFDSSNLRLCMQAINQLMMDWEDLLSFTVKYTQVRNLDTTRCLLILLNNRKYIERRNRRKKLLKKLK